MTAPVIFEVEVDARAAAIEVESSQVSVAPGDTRVVFAATPGLRGPRGLSGDGVPVSGEVLAGADGITTEFVTEMPYQPNSTAVYRNGLHETRGVTYFESAENAITFDEPPSSYDVLTISYVVA